MPRGPGRLPDSAPIGQLLAAAAQRIAAALGLEPRSARIEAASLFAHALGAEPAWLVAHAGTTLPAAQQAACAALIERRAAGEPVAYLTGRREFCGLAFGVTPAVLIPRPETEALVEQALARIAPEAPCRVLDLGTGSGCVAIAIAQQRPLARVTAVDASEAALAVARDNALRLLQPARAPLPSALTGEGRGEGAARLRLLRSDWFSALQGERFEVIVANPPYVAEGDPHLGQGDLRFEPRAALAAGADGLACIRHIVSDAPAYLAPGGWLLFEHGFDQAAACRELLRQAGFEEVCSSRDLAGIERISGGRRLTPGRAQG